MINKYIRYWQNTIFVGIIAFSVIPLTTWADSGPAHRVQQSPIQLGTSGGNINDSSRAFCYGGTLGALVEDNTSGTEYILSNNHVLATTNAAAIGEHIIHPGLIDQSPACSQDSSDIVADLSAFVPILFKTKGTMPPNAVDAAIAQVRVGKVYSTGSILDIGTLSSDTLDPSLGMAVKKSGPTTGLTNGNITAVSATINVSYGSGKTARFTNQIVVGSGDFIAAGDSGSLMVDGAVSTLKNFLQAVHHKFQLPIWLTEYSLIRWTKPPTYPSWEQQAKFASKSIEMLETLPFVERYAWFSLPPWMKDGSDRISLYYQNGDLTPAGVAFQKGPAMPPPNADAVGSEVDMGPGLVGDGFAAGSH